MKRILMAMSMLGALSACETPQQTMLAGAGLGAATGGVLADDNNKAEGALIGGAIGLAAGTLIGTTSSGQCVYQRQDGSRYTANC